MVRRTVHYAGRVQGVGFRFTAQRVAAGYDVTGYVRNLPDGRVEMIIEGDPDQVEVALDDLADRMAGYIRQTQIDQSPATGEFDDFGVRF